MVNLQNIFYYKRIDWAADYALAGAVPVPGQCSIWGKRGATRMAHSPGIVGGDDGYPIQPDFRLSCSLRMFFILNILSILVQSKLYKGSWYFHWL
jgi:hypothetical protein